MLYDLDFTSTPGYPYNIQAPTIGDWLKWNGVSYSDTQANLLWVEVQKFLSGDFSSHVYKVFPKMEVHNPSKVKDGRWRLIMSPSLACQVAWRMMFSEFQTSLMDSTGKHPCYSGAVYPGGGWRWLRNQFRRKGFNFCIDKRAWDQNAPGWIFKACLKLIFRLCRNPSKSWKKAVAAAFRDAFSHSVLLLPDGRLVRQKFDGLMKSGLFLTITINSLAQYILHCVAWSRAFPQTTPSDLASTGDDTGQPKPPDVQRYLHYLALSGCVVKEAIEGLEFMGFDLDKDACTIYPEKHIASFSYLNPDLYAEVLDSYLRIYANSPDRHYWRKIANILGVTVRSDSYYKYFWNNPDALLGYQVSYKGHSDVESIYVPA